MKFFNSEKEMPFFEIRKEDGTVEHLVCEGSRRHVINWDTNGRHCSEPNCKINKTQNKFIKGIDTLENI